MKACEHPRDSSKPSLDSILLTYESIEIDNFPNVLLERHFRLLDWML